MRENVALPFVKCYYTFIGILRPYAQKQPGEAFLIPLFNGQLHNTRSFAGYEDYPVPIFPVEPGLANKYK